MYFWNVYERKEKTEKRDTKHRVRLEDAMKKVGVVICNYNKQDYVLKCIEHILNQTMTDFDVYVVDNASTDDSVKRIQEQYGNQVHLVINQENLGGSGGFNSGMRKALEGAYDYLLLMDNDAFLEKDSLEKMYHVMQEREDIGIVGCKILVADQPDIIQDCGSYIDFDTYDVHIPYKRKPANIELPRLVECDYVPACALLIRRNVIEKIGLMPEQNFIYWDDMEWGYCCNKAGYKVVALTDAVVYHHSGQRDTGRTFAKYYLWRNRIRFFAKYLPEEKKEDFAVKSLTELFRIMYGSYLKEDTNIIKALMLAWEDGIHNVTGKAGDNRVLQRNGKDKLAEALKNKRDGQQVIECSHVLDYKEPYHGDIIKDGFNNVIASEEDYYYCWNYNRMLEAFLAMHVPVMLDAIRC